jgi:putative phosphonate metabolism protein
MVDGTTPPAAPPFPGRPVVDYAARTPTETGTLSQRYALYFAPPAGSPLAGFGARWLGRDAHTGAAVAQPTVDGVPPDRLAALTASPRLYGFHATLKAPFRLGPGVTADGLREALAGFAAGRRSFALRLGLRSLHGFLALMEAEPSDDLRTLADDCVTAFDAFRAPMPAEERERRARGLDQHHRAHLDRWGYPYVLDTFRFHMTLSERLSDGDAALLRWTLGPLAAAVCADPIRVDAVTLFVQPREGAPFVLDGRHPFGG